MSDDKLAFKLAEPEHVVLPLKLSREKWFEIADKVNEFRDSKNRRIWYRYEMDELYADLYPA